MRSQSRFLITCALIVASVVARAGSSAAQGLAKVDVTGKWLFTVNTSAGAGTPTLTLTQKGDSLTGHYSSQALGEADIRGAVKGHGVTINFDIEVQGTALAVTYTGTLDTSDSLKGTVDIGGQATGTFTGKRQ